MAPLAGPLWTTDAGVRIPALLDRGDWVAAPAVEPTTKSALPVRLLGLLLVGAAVSVALGVYGEVHDPTGEAPYTLFFTATINLKVWFATIAVALALVQILTAMRLYGKIPVPKDLPGWFGDVHRLSGTLAFGFSLPVAYQCLWALGFQSTDTRVLFHSLFGCFFYGVFTIKVLSVRSHGLPDWLLPVAGGAAFTALVAIWTTSSVWFWTEFGFPSF
jgi:hypothetical protein